jgi:hypothetical protein
LSTRASPSALVPGADRALAADGRGEPGNIPLGIGEPENFDQVKLKLATGDVVVLYTDSLIEVKDAGGRMLGQEGLLRLVQGLDASDPGAFMRSLLEAVSGHGGADGDDVTVLILRPNGLKPRVSSLVYAKVMARLAVAVVKGLLPGGEPFPFPRPRALVKLRALLGRGGKPAASKPGVRT